MSKTGIILDLDMTLVDSKCLFDLRAQRMWSKVYLNIPNTRLFNGVQETIDSLHEKQIITGVVTSSPRKYAEKVIKYHDLDLEVAIGYHDTRMHKPHPEPIKSACFKLGLNPVDDIVISIGDEIKDIAASKAIPDVTAIGVSWGLDSQEALINAGADLVVNSMDEILEYVNSF